MLGITQPAPGDWKQTQIGLDLHHRDRVPRPFGRGVRPLAGARRPAEERSRRGLLLGLGFLIAAFGVTLHNIWLIYLGYGVLAACGLGLGYITPVSTLIKWFPDRRGMATGMAIMGFGGGALIASPLSQLLMDRSVGHLRRRGGNVRRAGHRLFRGDALRCFPVPGAARGWAPAGWTPPPGTPAR